jgi:hypothetical protein
MNPNVSMSNSPSNTSSNVFTRLAWKEFRQLLPLIMMLATLSICLQLVSLISPDVNVAQDMRIIPFIGLPVLFAAGVGAMLVSQERDTKTLQWMTSIPISGAYQARIKWMVGLLALIGSWLLSGLLFAASSFAGNSTLHLNGRESDFPFHLAHSVFLLFAGLACAWFFRSTLVGLLALVGVAILVTISNIILVGNELQISETSRWLAWLVMVAVVFVAAQWAAAREYRPIRAFGARTTYDEFKTFFDASKLGWSNVLKPRDALLWQFAKQNRWLLLSGVGIFAVGCLLLCRNFRGDYGRWDQRREAIVLGFGCIGLAACVFGLSVFVGDSLHQRIRFLADRGVSQRAIWFTRQAIPLSLLIACSIVAASLGFFFNIQVFSGQPNDVAMTLLSASLASWVVFAATQWTTQVLRSPVLSTILAPIVSFVPFVYVGTLITELGVPIWIMPILSIVPFIATYRATRYWMDVQVGKWFWIEHAFWLSVAIVLPLLPASYAMLTLPSIPPNELIVFEADAKRFQERPSKLVAFNFPSSESPSSEDDPSSGMMGSPTSDQGTEEPDRVSPSKPKSAWDNPIELPQDAQSTVSEPLSAKLERFETVLAGLTTDDWIEERIESERLKIETILLRMKLESDKGSAADQAMYRRSMQCMFSICKGYRKGPRFDMQARADVYDAWLFRELKSDRVSEWIGKDLWLAIANYLQDSQGRNQARYRALVNAFKRSLSKQSPSGHLGTFAFVDRSSIKYVNDRAVGIAAWEIKQYLFAESDAERAKHCEAIATRFGVPVSRFGRRLGPLLYTGSNLAPCESWFGKWELEVNSLTTSSEETK